MGQSCDGPVTGDDIEVANILLEMPHLLFESESRHRFSFTWGSKRKRSTSAKEQEATTSSPARKLSPSPAPSLPSKTAGSTSETDAAMEKVLTSSPATPLSFSPSESDEKPPPSKKKASTSETDAAMEKVLTSSPATPLSFSPSESDEKPPPSKKRAPVNSLKKKKEQLLEMMKDFTQRNELLRKDIENKNRFLDQQKAENLELKAKKQKLSQSLRTAEEPRLETSKGLNLEKQLTEISLETGNSTGQDYHHQQRISTRDYQQPFTMDQTVYREVMNNNSGYPFGRMISWLPSNTVGLGKLHGNVSPLGLPDLNVSAEEALCFSTVEPIDLDTAAKARAAEARLKRKQICRSKSYNAACKARYTFR